MSHRGQPRRREDLPWSTAVWILFAALFVNSVGLYGTSKALSDALKTEPERDEEELVEFDLVEPPVSQPPGTDTPDEPEPASPTPEPDSRREPGPAKDPSETARGRPGGAREGSLRPGDAAGEAGEQEPGPGDDSLAEAPDGQTADEGAAPGAQAGTDPLAGLGGSTSMLDQTFGRPDPRPQPRKPDEGVSEILSNRENLYASFFNRIRGQVADQWREPSLAYSAEGHVTGLMVRLDGKGKIVKIVVEHPCGFAELDALAVETMKAAAPFPNPPAGLVDEDGYIVFHFGFQYTERRTRIFRRN